MPLSGPIVSEPRRTRAWLRAWLLDAVNFVWIIISSRAYVERAARAAISAGEDPAVAVSSWNLGFARALDRKFWGALVAVLLGTAVAIALSHWLPLRAGLGAMFQLGGAGLGLIAAVGMPKPDAYDATPSERAAMAGADLLLFLAFATGAYGTLAG